MYFDSHAHVNFNAYRDDGEEVLKKALKEGVLVANVVLNTSLHVMLF